ncbi:MAG: hypothetical protein AB7N76_09420 [Planctomycetota bacterium]
MTSRVWVEVGDLRFERPATGIGVARVTMGIPRAVPVAGNARLDEALCAALIVSLGRAGFAAQPLDPGALAAPGLDLPGQRVLQLVVDELWSDAYFGELTLELGWRLRVLDGEGRLLARAERPRVPRLEPSAYADGVHHARVLEAILQRELRALFTRDILAALRGERPPPPPPSADAAGEGKGAKLATNCAGCGLPLEEGWQHCPRCGRRR